MQISGRVSSLTSATSGPATFVNDTNSMYTAVKPLEFDLSGIRLGETEVEVDNKITLRNVKTDFDGIPLVSQLAKGVARSQRDAKEPELTREVKEKVAATARAADRRRDHGPLHPAGRAPGGEGVQLRWTRWPWSRR